MIPQCKNFFAKYVTIICTLHYIILNFENNARFHIVNFLAVTKLANKNIKIHCYLYLWVRLNLKSAITTQILKWSSVALCNLHCFGL